MVRVRPRVLIVDENAANRDALRTYFESKPLEAGAFDVATTPFDLRGVRQLIDAAMEHASLRRFGEQVRGRFV